MVRRIGFRLFWIAASFAFASACYAQDENKDLALPQIEQARALIKEGKYADAYTVLEPLEARYTGNIQYDYLLGVSEVNSDKASLAVFALERVQLTNPRFEDVGLWLSIAYYRSGNRENAIDGFNDVLALSKNADARASASQYLRLIRQEEDAELRKSTSRYSLFGMAEYGLGYDDNISNLSTDYASAQQAVNTQAVSPSNLAGFESIYHVALEGRMAFSGNYAFVSVDDELRDYNGNTIMDTGTLITKGGLNFSGESTNYKVDYVRRQFRQNGFFAETTSIDNDYDLSGLENNLRYRIAQNQFVGLLADYSLVRFHGYGPQDTNQAMIGANYLYSSQAPGKPLFYLGYAIIDDRAEEMERALNPAYNDGMTEASRVTNNLTLYMQYSLRPDVALFTSDYVNFRRDTGAYARDATVAYGRDRTKLISVGMYWRFRPMWTLRPLLAKTINDSNLHFYSYSKLEGTVTLRYDFK
jgi:outer membrane protein